MRYNQLTVKKSKSRRSSPMIFESVSQGYVMFEKSFAQAASVKTF